MSYSSLGFAGRGFADFNVGGLNIPTGGGGGGVGLPGLPDLSQVGAAIVSAVGPPIIAQLKKEIPGLVAQIRPQIEAEVHKLEMGIWTSPEVAALKKKAMIGAAVYALLIVGGTWAAVKYL